eukprot:CAMPEP_0195254096 /NCGR_PEP_ID=MMETSP0706-20130129/4860_1 /TAXON_ID=33640 /ORGANISM="Asterionellopsis glacialis, Strain CCMP134" /LENGTH=100 /DNA_ID=CAMNT_0040306729 /DNA_START=26 /DNA_END=324 /DNA_ORIENTATION=-
MRVARASITIETRGQKACTSRSAKSPSQVSRKGHFNEARRGSESRMRPEPDGPDTFGCPDVGVISVSALRRNSASLAIAAAPPISPVPRQLPRNTSEPLG